MVKTKAQLQQELRRVRNLRNLGHIIVGNQPFYNQTTTHVIKTNRYSKKNRYRNAVKLAAKHKYKRPPAIQEVRIIRIRS